MSEAKLLDGRAWSCDKRGVTALTRRYLVVRDEVTGASSEEVAGYENLPAIGSAHETHENLVVTGYSVEEKTGGEKRAVVVAVKYDLPTQTIETSQTGSVTACESWGWSSGSVSRDLTHDAVTGLQVLNSAGDPFDTVPQVDRPAPVFTKVIKTKSINSSWFGLVDKVNNAKVTIGGMECDVGTVRVSQVDVQRIVGDAEDFKYRYTFGLQYMSNMVLIDGEEAEIGWDVAVVDQGCREKTEGGEVRRITDEDDEGNVVPVSLPVLLDGSGCRLMDENADPVMIRINAYKRATIPAIFYSEPTP